jgi:lipoyl(octanoyl) transferase
LAPAWETATGLIDYPLAIERMETHVAAMAEGKVGELIWLLEHPPIYTAGTSAQNRDLIEPDRFPVYRTGRGGQFTYHGPGQRVAYVMLDLRRRGGDLHAYVSGLERWLIGTLSEFGVTGEVRTGRVGVWVARDGQGPAREDKIAAIGVRVRRGISYHGVSLNVAPDLTHFGGIVPCGISAHGVTSLVDLGVAATMAAVDAALKKHFEASVVTALKRV